jgi:hypothetical protein
MQVGRNLQLGRFGFRAELFGLRRGPDTRHDGKPDQPEQQSQDRSEGGETFPALLHGQMVGAEPPDDAPNDSEHDSHDFTS